MLRAGISADQIRARVRRGSMIRVHRGVYRVGHAAPSREAAYMAAVKAAGPHAALAGEAALLRGILWGEAPMTLSHLERAFLSVIAEAGLPLPSTNIAASGRIVDCRWPEHRLTVELDGYRYHSSRYAWERDRRREREARARGDEFRRYSYGDVVEEPEAMLSELRRLLPAVGG